VSDPNGCSHDLGALAELKEKTVKLRFTLKNASLYSY
jgi:hypothetical protein